MITWHVTAIAGPNDAYQADVTHGQRELRVPFGMPTDEDRVESSIAKVFAKYRLELDTRTEDLVHLAIVAYTADVRVPRDDGFGAWTRDLRLHAFVREVDSWSAAVPLIERVLAFLTGDHWTVDVREAPADYVGERLPPPKKAITLTGQTVCLFSGGLDSYIGAIDAAATGEQVILVGHHSAGGGATSRSQNRALAELRQFYPEEQTPFLRIWISPPKGRKRASETTTRGRSILFFALGIAVARARKATRLIVPENGFISLNVPLSPSRLGSLSTRTTHPHFVELLREILTTVGIDVPLDLPYRFRTKGEMMRDTANANALNAGVAATMSCARPAAGRFSGDPNIHCGRCVPCLIRRAAISSVRTDPTSYRAVDVHATFPGESGIDLMVVRMALERFAKKPPRLADVLLAGPLPGPDAEKQEFLGVFARGLDEIRALFA